MSQLNKGINLFLMIELGRLPERLLREESSWRAWCLPHCVSNTVATTDHSLWKLNFSFDCQGSAEIC